MGTLARRLCTVGLLAPAFVLGCGQLDRRHLPYGCTCLYYPNLVARPAGKPLPFQPSPYLPPPAPVPQGPVYLPDVAGNCPAREPAAEPRAVTKMPPAPVAPPAPTKRPAAEPAHLPTAAAPRAATLDLAEVSEPALNRPGDAPAKALVTLPQETALSIQADTIPSPTFVDAAPGAPTFGHAPDYAWLRGEVQQSRRGTRLRYAPVDEVDPYGGSVTLVGNVQIEGLRDGQFVRVRGQLLHPEAHTAAPAYKVLAVEPAGR
jgi:hypothetical protein